MRSQYGFARNGIVMHDSVSSGNLVADKRAEYARMLSESGDFSAAAELMEQALDLVPGWIAGWFQAGGYLEKSGNLNAAIAAYNHVVRASTADKYGARLKLAHLRGDELDEPQIAYVEALFDGYAARFDKSLVENLGYRVPQYLAEMLEQVEPDRTFEHCVDLGCGTGLMAQALGGRARRNTGIDLSGAMLKKAEDKKLYDKLIKADLTDGMLDAGPADLIIGADVFMYLGALAPVISASHSHLLPGGIFAFSVELSKAVGGYELLASMRHAHSAAYVGKCLAASGFETLATKISIIRTDGPDTIDGLLTIARKPFERMNADG